MVAVLSGVMIPEMPPEPVVDEAQVGVVDEVPAPPPPQAPPPPSDVALLLHFLQTSTEIWGPINGLLGAITTKVTGESVTANRTKMGLLSGAGFLVLVIIVGVFVMVSMGKMGGDSATFLLGVIVGALITLSRDFLISGKL